MTRLVALRSKLSTAQIRRSRNPNATSTDFYVLDETGEGHWDFASSSLSHQATSVAALFAGDEKDPAPSLNVAAFPWVSCSRRIPITSR